MEEQFRNSLVSHDVESVKELLKQSEALQTPVIDNEALSNQLLKFKWLLLDVVGLGKPELTRLFLMRGNESMNVDDGPLHRAVYNFDVDHVRLFLQEFNADPNKFDENSRAPMYHIYFGNCEHRRKNFQLPSNHDKAVKIMKMLIDKEAKIVTPRDGCNELQARHILENGTTEAVSIILDMGVIDLKERYIGGYTVAHYLAQNRNPNTLTLLQKRDFHVNARDDYGRTPLWMAAVYGVAHAVEFLLNKGADVNIGSIGNGINSTPFHIAMIAYRRVEENHTECIFLLLDHGVDVQAPLQPDGPDDDDHPHITVFNFFSPDNRSAHLPYEIIIQHLALQAAIGTSLTEPVQKMIDSYDILKEQLAIGRRLLQSQILGSHTLFSVLTCAEERLVSLMRNEQLAQILQSHSDHLKSIDSIYYNRLLQKRLTKAGQIVKLRGKTAFVVGKLMKMNYNCQLVVIDIILQYLDLADLDTLVSLSL